MALTRLRSQAAAGLQGTASPAFDDRHRHQPSEDGGVENARKLAKQ
jgi:hypothetical protein